MLRAANQESRSMPSLPRSLDPPVLILFRIVLPIVVHVNGKIKNVDCVRFPGYSERLMIQAFRP